MPAAPRRLGLALALVATFAAVHADAKKSAQPPDPALRCVASKHLGAGLYCAGVLGAWARFEQNGKAARRDAAIAAGARKLGMAWARAETKSTAAGVECGGAFLASSAAAGFIDSASAALVDAVNAGLNVHSHAEAACGARILRVAGVKCAALFAIESVYEAHRARPQASRQRADAIARVQAKFAAAFGRATHGSCPTTATAQGVESSVDTIVGGVVRDTLLSPAAGDGTYVPIDGADTAYEGRTFHPQCLHGTPYRFFARRGTVNKLVMYYQGGGACWEQLTCGVPTCDVDALDEDPQKAMVGLADESNPANPFHDWNVVFVSYCSCDIHFGDAAQDYANTDPAHPLHVEHRGFENAKVAEKWAREHFLAPEVVFVTGSSAGAYGAWFHAPLLHHVWPSARFHVLADAGNGVVTQDFLQTYFPHWNFEANLPSDIPELKQVLDNGQGIPAYTEVVAKTFPKTNWAHYSTAFDGGSGGQTGFYDLMLHNNDPLAALTWWEGSCAFHGQMRAQALETAMAIDATTKNYRYYIGSGSRHTMFGSNKVYTDTTGGVPTIVDWIDAMLKSTPSNPDPGWFDVEANPSNVVLPGDPRPSPLASPFVLSGAQTVIDCPAGP